MSKSNNIPNGGPAFPSIGIESEPRDTHNPLHGMRVYSYEHAAGMTLRDYFAAKAPMPNAAETCSITGWRSRESVPMPTRMDLASPEYNAWAELPRFQDLWNTIDNAERCRICAVFQYAFADAMLKERASPTPNTPGGAS